MKPFRESQTAELKELNGRPFWLRNYDRSIVAEQKKEPWSSFLKLNKEDRVLDAGAHIGIFPFLNHDKVGKVFCFEPCPENFPILKKNTDVLANVELFNSVVAKENGERNFCFAKLGCASGSLLRSFVKAGTTVEAVSIDEFCKEKNINKIKMDIEGAEWECITSLSDEALQGLEGVALEFHSKFLSHQQEQEIRESLERKFVLQEKILNKNWGTKIIYTL